ncbi:MAG: LON peptidase substrate-binding domain-containing protein, partial [Desulfuromonadales bacterium]|nr:LON peptidase substrate-binding domain-containing protein [Desulfuromonadales bacterium]
MTDFPDTDNLTPEPAAPVVYPVLPLRDIVIFPHMVTPLFVGRPRSIQALEWAMEHDKEILLVTQKDPKTDDPLEDDLFVLGTLGQVVQMLKLPDGTVKVLVEGKVRAKLTDLEYSEECIFAQLHQLPDQKSESAEQEALMRSVSNTFESYANLSKKIPPEMVTSISGVEEPGRFADTIVAQLSVQISDKQEVLEELEPMLRLER